MYRNGGRFRCVNWTEVGLSLVGGGLLNGLLKGAGKLSTSTLYKESLREYRTLNKVPGKKSGNYQEVHHWAIEANGSVGKHIPDWIKNQPWNYNAVPKPVHDAITFRRYNALERWWYGTPGWALEVEFGLGGTAAGVLSGCGCE